jgi:protein SCO1
MTTQKKWLAFILIDCILVLSFIAYLLFVPETININGIFLKNPLEINDFQLTDNLGNPLTKKDLQGNWTFLFFGFTRCPMVCPTSLATLNKMYIHLEKELPASQLPKVIFITIDPEHDSIDQLNHYVNSFNPHFVGAKGDMNQTRLLEKDLHVTISKINDTLSHTPDIILLNPDVKVQAYFTYPHQFDQLASDYKIIIKKNF